MNKLAKKITAMAVAAILTIGSTIGLMAAEPVRSSFEDAGATVTWDYDNRLIVIEIMGGTVVFEPGSYTALVNDTPVQLSTPVFIQDSKAFIEMEDLTTVSLALMGIEPVEGEHGTTIVTAQALAAQFMELAQVPDFTIAIVNTNTGFAWTDTMSDATDADTIFHLGSIAKTFAAVGAMQLVEQGLLDLDTPIVEYIPEFTTQPSARGEGNYQNITARMLLSHTAGIYTNDMGSGAVTLGDHYQYYMNNFLDRFANTRMVREEGTAYEYANNGFVLVGILIARILGHDNYFEGFNQFMLENVFEPMGLARTSYVITDEHRPYVAGTYTAVGVPQPFKYFNSMSSGSMFSTANEMVSIMTMFLNDGYYNGNQILTAESINQMFTDQTGTGHYGLGIGFMGDVGGTGNAVIGHNGGMVYNFSAMFVDREHGLGVFVAGNSTTSQGLTDILAANILATAIVEVGGELAPPPISHVDPEAVPIELTDEELDAITGLYLAGGGMLHFFVEVVDGQLQLRVPAQATTFALFPMSDGHFDTDFGVPIWLIQDDYGNVFYVEGANRYAVVGARVDKSQFIPNEDFMENWYGFIFEAYREKDFYVLFMPTMTHGINEDGLAYSNTVVINMLPGATMVVLDPMDSDVELQYEDGVYFFYYWGLRFVRQ